MKHIRTFENFYLSDEEINNKYPGSEEKEEGMEREIDHEDEYPGYEDEYDEFSGEEEEEETMGRHRSNEYEDEFEEEEQDSIHRPYEEEDGYERKPEFEKFNPLPTVHKSLRHKSKKVTNKKWGNSINPIRTLSPNMNNSIKGPRKNKH